MKAEAQLNPERWKLATTAAGTMEPESRRSRSGLCSHRVRGAAPLAWLGVVCLALMLAACQPTPPASSVVVYTAVDQVHAEPILQEFEHRTGIRVKPVFDVEAAKTTGLVHRLLAEKSRPQADVFWNGEFSQTLFLKTQGALAAYTSPGASDLPTEYRDPEGYWTAFGGRARLFIINTGRLPADQFPRSLMDLLSPRWPAAQLGLANPLFGSTATQAAALYASWGPEKARNFFVQLHQRGVRVLDGNSTVKNFVAQGRLIFGLTDTDDFAEALERQAPVAGVLPDQEPGGLGTLIIPMTAALIHQAPHPETGKRLLDYLLSREVEERLERSGFVNLSRRSEKVHPALASSGAIRPMAVSLEDICRFLPQAQQDLREIFLR